MDLRLFVFWAGILEPCGPIAMQFVAMQDLDKQNEKKISVNFQQRPWVLSILSISLSNIIGMLHVLGKEQGRNLFGLYAIRAFINSLFPHAGIKR